jgi:hypothetical protein
MVKIASLTLQKDHIAYLPQSFPNKFCIQLGIMIYETYWSPALNDGFVLPLLYYESDN